MSLCTDLRNAKYVFWPYDTFPFTLGAEALPRPNGMWYAWSYQMTVKPIAVFELEVGKGITRELAALETARYKEQKQMEANYLAKALEFAPFIDKRV